MTRSGLEAPVEYRNREAMDERREKALLRRCSWERAIVRVEKVSLGFRGIGIKGTKVLWVLRGINGINLEVGDVKEKVSLWICLAAEEGQLWEPSWQAQGERPEQGEVLLPHCEARADHLNGIARRRTSQSKVSLAIIQKEEDKKSKGTKRKAKKGTPQESRAPDPYLIPQLGVDNLGQEPHEPIGVLIFLTLLAELAGG